MGFPGTGKIWMNGKFVDWRDATIHIASHVIHYGSGVFEGARCYSTPKGSACFRLDAHMRRLHDSAKIYRMEYPLDLAGWMAGRARYDSRQRNEGLLHPPARVSRVRDARRQPARQPRRRGHHGVGMGRIPGTGSARTGRRRQGQFVDAPGAEHAAGDGQEHGKLRQLRADQDGSGGRRLLRRPSPSTSTATSARAAARTCFSCATARSTRRPLASSILGGITRDTVITLARELGYAVTETVHAARGALHRGRGVFRRHGGRGDAGSVGRQDQGGRRPPRRRSPPRSSRRSSTSSTARRPTGTAG